MFAAAPPAYVVALLVQVLWIPLRFLEMAGWDSLALHDRDINTSLNFVATTLFIGASWELVHRGRGRVRAAMALTFAMNLVGLGTQVFVMVVILRREPMHGAIGVLSWLWPTCALLSVLGLAIAAGRRPFATTISVVVLSIGLFQLPPVGRAIADALGGAVFWVFIALVPIRNLLLVRLVGDIAKQCYEPVRDHRRASRGFTLLAWLFAVRAAIAVVIIALGTSTILVQMWLVGIQIVVLMAFAYLAWTIAQTQLPQLSRYAVFFAAASVMLSAFILAHNAAMIVGLDPGNWYQPATYFEELWWQLVPATLGVAWLVVTLGRYAKQVRAIKPSVVLGGAVFTATACWGLLARDTTATWLCIAIGSVAMIPAFRATAKALAGDPAQTTADVFA